MSTPNGNFKTYNGVSIEIVDAVARSSIGLTPAMYKSDDDTDDTQSFSKCIIACIKSGSHMYIPAGTYTISGNLPKLPKGFSIRGDMNTKLSPLNGSFKYNDDDENTDMYTSSGTVIIDNRTGSDQGLFHYEKTVTIVETISNGTTDEETTAETTTEADEETTVETVYYGVGAGGISDITIKTANSTNTLSAVVIDCSGAGWVSLFENVRFSGYGKYCVYTNCCDTRFNNCMFVHCNQGDDTDAFAVYLTKDLEGDPANEQRFTGCLFEDNNRHLHISAGFNNYFTNCKFECDPDKVSTVSPVLIDGGKLVTFANCNFVYLDIERLRRLLYGESTDKTYDDVPSLITSSISHIRISDSDFQCGLGGTVKTGLNWYYQAKYIHASYAQINGNKFINASYRCPAVVVDCIDSSGNCFNKYTVISGNDFVINGNEETNYLAAECPVVVSVTMQIDANNTFSVIDGKPEFYPTTYFSGCEIAGDYRTDIDSNGCFYTNGNFRGTTPYTTFVLRPTLPGNNSEYLGHVKLIIQSIWDDDIRGELRFNIKYWYNGSTISIRSFDKVDSSGFYIKNSSSVYISFAGKNVYIQVGSNAKNMMTARLEMYNAPFTVYVDKSLNALVTAEKLGTEVLDQWELL